MIKIDFSSFPTDDSHAQIPGKLFIIDNIDTEEAPQQSSVHRVLPVQVTMAVVAFCVKGSFNMNVGLKSVTLKDNDVLILLPGNFFEIVSVEPGTKAVMMAISPDFMNIGHDIRMGIEFSQLIGEKPAHSLSQEDMDEVINHIRALKAKLLNKEYRFKENMAKNYMGLIQCCIFNSLAPLMDMQHEQKPTNRKEEIFHNFMLAVKSNYKQNRSITFYADILCISPKYLSSVVKEVSGKYATEWITNFVILEAKALLRRDGASVKDVTAQLNFANQSFFAKFFKQHTGYAPRKYINL